MIYLLSQIGGKEIANELDLTSNLLLGFVLLELSVDELGDVETQTALESLIARWFYDLHLLLSSLLSGFFSRSMLE